MQGDRFHAMTGVQEGDTIAGKYKIESILGEGGMGVVVAAHHVQLDEKVAIKFVLSEMLTDAHAVSRFVQEARAAVRIKSEHVARVLDVGTLPNGAPFMVMEFLEGIDLGSWLERHGPMPIDRAVDCVLQTCIAIAEAHSLGIVHRDLKPAHLFCVRGSDGAPTIKVLDFGISKDVRGARMSVTKTSMVLGSPLYMSPEQMRSAKDVGTQTDIWSLGVILFELLSGVTPFTGDAFTEVAVKVATEPPALLRSVRPDAPPALERLIARCLEKDRRARIQNVGELAAALAEFGPPGADRMVERITKILQTAARFGPSSSHPAPDDYYPPSSPTPVSPIPAAASKPPRRRRRATMLLLIALLAVALVIFLWNGRVRDSRTAVLEDRASSSGGDGLLSAGPAPSSAPGEAKALEPLAPSTPTTAIAVSPVAVPAPNRKTSYVAPASAPKSIATAPANDDCGVAFYFDARGNRVFKHDCVGTQGKGAATARAGTAADHAESSCDPPFYFDARGNRVFKRDCL